MSVDYDKRIHTEVYFNPESSELVAIAHLTCGKVFEKRLPVGKHDHKNFLTIQGLVYREAIDFLKDPKEEDIL